MSSSSYDEFLQYISESVFICLHFIMNVRGVSDNVINDALVFARSSVVSLNRSSSDVVMEDASSIIQRSTIEDQHINDDLQHSINNYRQTWISVCPYLPMFSHCFLNNSLLSGTGSPRTIFVVDTNVLLNDLDLLMSLPVVELSVLVIVPSAVVIELDSLKSRNDVSYISRRAIRFLHECFTYGNYFIRGQNPSETSLEITSKLADDQILACALYFFNHLPSSCCVVLLSNDLNLCIKANIRQIPSISLRDMIQGVIPSKTSQQILSMIELSNSQLSTNMSLFSSIDSVTLHPICRSEEDNYDICMLAFIAFESCMSIIVVDVMKSKLGESIWEDCVKVKKKDWDTRGLLKLLTKHKSLFPSCLVSPGKDILEYLCKVVPSLSSESTIKLNDAYDIIEKLQKLLLLNGEKDTSMSCIYLSTLQESLLNANIKLPASYGDTLKVSNTSSMEI